MITEKKLLKISGKHTLIGLAISLFFWLVVFDLGICHAQTQTGFRIPARLDIGGGRMTGDMWCQYGTNGVRFKIGTQAVTQVGTVGVINGTNATGLPSLDFTYGGGSMSANFNGFNAVYVAGSQVGTSGALAGKIDVVGGTGTTNVFTNTTLAGVGTITASFGANGLVISPAEYATVNNATSELQAQIDGKQPTLINNTPGTITNVLGYTPPANTQGSITTALGYTPPANTSGSITTALGYTPPANTSGSITTALGYTPTDLGNSIALGTETTGTTDNVSEGSTNKYYTDGRVNAAVGSLSVNTLSDCNIIFNENDFVKIAGGQLVAGSSTVTVAFSEVTGSASASQLPLISGLLGSATPAQLPPILRLYGTTTEQVAGAYGQLYVKSSGGGAGLGTFGTLTSESLVSYYALENLNDNFGSNNLTNYGATTFVAGKYNNCATFNGTTQYLQTSVLSTQTTNISMFSWVYIASASEARPFFNNGIDGADTNGYALGVGNTSFENAGNNLVGQVHGVAVFNFATAIGTGWHHVGMTRDGTTWRGYIDKVQCVTTFTNNPVAPSGNFTIGRNFNGGVHWYYNDKIDDVVFYNKTLSAGEIKELYDNTGGSGLYTQYLAKYADPVNGNTVFEILTPGTSTTQASYIYNNATTTVWGLGTNTAVTGTTSGAYAGWTNRPIRVLAVDIGSSKEIKENIKTIKVKPDLLDAEGIAKQNYIANAKVAWIAANGGSYTTMVNETGTGSVVVVDTDKMESDYNNYIELEWAADLNQDVYTETVQKQHEIGFWQMYNSVTPKSWNPIVNPLATYEGFIVEEMPDVVKGDDGQSINIMSVVAYMSVVQQTLKADTIFALSTLKELIMTGTVTQQKIDYVQDRLEVLNP